MLILNKYHLSYCTNVHPGEDWQETFDNLAAFLPGIRDKMAGDAPFGIGLRLSNLASLELGLGGELQKFKQWLQENKLYVFTMNGFPYGNFHGERVKDLVHRPDWTTEDRVTYTIRLFRQLAYLLPDKMSGSISTSPITYRHWHKSNKNVLDRVFTSSALNYAKVVTELCKIEQETGKHLHLNIEPEPDGLLENSEEVVRFFEEYLVPLAGKSVRDTMGVSLSKGERLVYRHINVCYDVCHFSLAYEEPEYSFKKFETAGIGIGKIQISAALKIIFDATNVDETWNTLAQFNEPTYLHQVTEKTGGKVKTYGDLPEVLKRPKQFKEIRAHFHVPLFLEKYGTLWSTQDQIIKVVEYLKTHKVTDHLEVETYTWEVLPGEFKSNLSDSIIRELLWVKEKLA